LAVSPDAVAELSADGSVRRRRTLSPRVDHVEQISPDGGWILTGRRDALTLWSATRELEPVMFEAAGDPVTATAVSPDGTRLLSGHQYGTVLVWSIDLDPASLVDTLWRATPYCLSIEERQTLLAEDLATARQGRKAALDRAYTHHADSLGAAIVGP